MNTNEKKDDRGRLISYVDELGHFVRVTYTTNGGPPGSTSVVPLADGRWRAAAPNIANACAYCIDGKGCEQATHFSPGWTYTLVVHDRPTLDG